ncbi:BatD family protein [Pseudoxanthobacter sp.]|uniref:BatD family protein n=1 Tax=Pseudoxanthobacter sp. TaxID=1925742 RepID=UPI002FE1692B
MSAPVLRSRRLRRAAATLALAAALSAALAAGALAGSLTALVDRTRIEQGETFSLILRLNGPDAGGAPDLSALEKDFTILDRRQQTRTVVTNGAMQNSVDWVVTLVPKRTGKIGIPAFRIGSERSDPLQINVVKPSAASEKKAVQPLYVEMTAGNTNAFVQSDIPITVRVFDSVGLRGGSLTDPTAEGATFTPTGEQRGFAKTINGRRYLVIEQDYLMRPQRSGTIEVAPVTLNARLPVTGRNPMVSQGMQDFMNGNGFDPSILDGLLDAARPTQIRSNPLTIDVRARPAEAQQGWFLPARKVTLTDSWKPALKEARVGEALSRTLRLAALGATENQLPPLPVTPVDGVRQYEEASKTRQDQTPNGSTAVLEKTVSVVPTRTGTVTLPEISVKWWNTATSKEETVTLPAETFTVLPGANGETGEAPPAVAAGAAGSAAPAAGEAAPPAPQESAPPEIAGLLQRLRDLPPASLALAAAVAVAVIGGVVLMLRRRRAATPFAPAGAPSAGLPAGAGDEAGAAQAVEAAARQGDAAATHRAFLVWQRLAAGGGPRTAGLQAAADTLTRQLYSTVHAGWDGRAFLTAFRAERALRAPARPRRGAPIGPLYPQPPRG